ncbi:MAG TPA: hypothetical protein VJ890_25270 [Vineibacter sp.]|nr:hypothetical protein [Vineibacter sp.]
MLFRNLPAGPACERCDARTFVASIEPHLEKRRYARYVFECPRCYHLTRMSVADGVSGRLERLQLADAFVAKAAFLIERQETLIQHLTAQGRDIGRAEALLVILQESMMALTRWQSYVSQRRFI